MCLITKLRIENKKQNQTLNVSLSDNISSHWNKGGSVLEWSLCVPDFWSVRMLRNLWVERRVEIVSLTSTVFHHRTGDHCCLLREHGVKSYLLPNIILDPNISTQYLHHWMFRHAVSHQELGTFSSKMAPSPFLSFVEAGISWRGQPGLFILRCKAWNLIIPWNVQI